MLCAAVTARPSQAAALTTHIYLDFLSEATSFVAFAADDASADQARLAPSEPFAPFPWGLVGDVATREQAVNRVASKVGELFAPFDVAIHLTRPQGVIYTMAVISGDATSVGLPTELEGLSLIDCNDANASNVSFVFATPPHASVDEIAIAISHELGHSFGLEHSSLPTDIMFAERSPDRAAFQDQNADATAPDPCGVAVQNSHARLLELLGVSDPNSPPSIELLPEPPSMGGCAVAPRPAARAFGRGWLFLAAAVGLVRRRRSPTMTAEPA
jgi:hypothetical protein